MGVLRKMIPKHLDDLLCDFNYVATAMQTIDDKLIEIPLFYTKQLVKELCIFPLGWPFWNWKDSCCVSSSISHRCAIL